MAYDPNHEYRFTDGNGNTFTSRGDNGYVWQAVTEGIPISVDSNGNWYTEPYLDVEKTGYVAHIPNWFKETDEYSQWQTYASQIPNLSVNKTVFENLNGILKQLGSQGALRTSLSQDIKSYGVKDKALIDKYVKDIVSMAAEGQGGDKAKITLFGTEYNSAADLARHYKDLSKEDLSEAMTSMYGIMDKGAKGEWTDKEEYLADAVTAAKILNYVDDNHISYGNDDEFNGLLSSSVWQQINRGLTQFMGGVSSNTFVGIPARVAYGAMNASTGKDFNMKIEDLYNERLATGPDLGAGLEGNEAADVVGMWGGAIGSIAVTMATSMMMGSAINGKVAASAPGGFWNNVGTFAQTIPGAAVSDFFLNDVPLDLMIFTTDAMRDGIDKAWYDPENPQPLFGIPFIRQGQDGNFYPSGFGPDVPGGLGMNLVGDAVLDAAIPFLGIVGNATYKTLDNMTGGGVTRVREKAGVLNLRIQQKLTSIPVLGTGWQKFVNYMMGAENAQYMREARKAAIAEGSMEPYVRAQNLLTLTNHSGMEVVSPLYKQLDEELGISKSLKEFQKNAKTYGGNGETKVEWKEIKRGVEQKLSKTVPDTIPRQVKQGLLDTERLSELRGEEANEGGILVNPARQKEIAEIQSRLEKTPQEIKDFAQKFSELNKRVEALGVDLGITKQEWIDALQLDPRWESYMTRQALVPGGGAVSTGTNAPDAAILNAKRKGYYADNYIDPTLALGMKVEALGRAFAWNERAKALVSFEISQGKVIAGKAGVDVAARLAEVKEQIKQGTEFRKSIGYDEQLGSIRTDTETISGAFRKINDLLNLPEQLSLKSVYEATQNPRIKEFISNFNNGKIKFADGVKEAAGLSDSEAANIIQNTYVQKGDSIKEITETEMVREMSFDDDLAPTSIGDFERGDFSIPTNKNGEIDAGVNGLTKRQKEKARKLAEKRDEKAREKTSRENSAAFEEYTKLHDEWLENMREFLFSRLEKRSASEAAKDPFAEKIYDEFFEKYPEPKRPDLIKAPDSETIKMIEQEVALAYRPEKLEEYLVDSKAPLDFKIFNFDPKNSRRKSENNFNYLTRGENRRALYKKGYDSLDAKTKAQVDKADNAFTQRLTHDTVLYRGEPGSSNITRRAKVGEDLDTRSWTYTQILPEETELYRQGATASTAEQLFNISNGVLYRYHLKEGSPVFYKPSGDGFGTETEMVLPRGAKATVVNVQKGFREIGNPFKENPRLLRATIVDVVVDPNSGVTPRLQSQRIGDSGPSFVDGREYAKNVTPDSRKNIDGYKQFKEDHLERVGDTELSPETEDFITHIVRPGGDVDVYNSFLRDGTYKDKSDWAHSYIDDFEDRYADEIEDIAFQFFQSDAEKIAKEFEVDFNEKGYWETMIKYQGALKDMLAEKILEGLEGNYRLKDNTILYRGVNTEGTKLNPAGDFSWLKEGAEFKDNGFGFVSLSDNAAKHYADGGNGEKIILEYKVPEGQKLFYFGEIGKGGNDGGAFVLPAEITGTVGRIVNGEDGYKHVEILIGPAAQTRIGDAANIPDTASPSVRYKVEEAMAKANYNAGVTADGVPYKYTVENGEITSFEKLESSDEYATTINTLGGVYNISADTIDQIGKINAEAVIRTILYYRDNMPNIGTGPTYHFDGHSGSWGYIWPATYNAAYGWKLVDGHIEAREYGVYMGRNYRAGNEAAAIKAKQAECETGFKPKNTGTLESTPQHEGGHSLMMQLAVHKLNRMADDGLIKLPEDSFEIGRLVEDTYDDLHALVIDRAMKRIGYEKYTEADISREANTISEYASSTDYGKDKAGRWKHDEIMSESQRMYAGNGQNSSKFCLAIIEEMKNESSLYANAAAPAEVFAKNNLAAPKGLFKDDQYAFPSKAKTSNQKAKWLDEWRQNNPYLKGKGLFTEENYQLANLWDTYFQKEIYAYNPNSKTSMPDILSKKNGDFLEDLSSTAAKKMVAEIKQASIEGFDEKLATMALSRNSSDIAKAMDEFIIGRVNKAAEEIAGKMVGGATPDNLNTARMTLWSDSSVRNDFINLVSSLSPDIDAGNINSKITELFDTQAKGFASVEALPVDMKKMQAEQEKLTEKLYKENNYARAKGKAVDGELKNYRGEVTQVVHYKESGEDVYVVVSDPVLADILKKPNDYQETGIVVESLAQAANFISRAYRLGTTGANPIAFVRNVLRDPMQATIQGGFNPLNMSLSPEVFYHTLRNFGLDEATIKNVTARLQTWAGSSGMTAEMRNMGITTPGTVGYRNRIEKWSKKFQTSDGKFKHAVEKAEAPLETWETMFRNQIAQQSFVKNYERFKDVNKAMGMAMFDASNSTTNFSHSVGLFKRATSTVPYLSSAINGTRSFWVQFNVDPIGMMTRITAGFMVPAMAITAWNLSSQERRDSYMNLPEWYKQSHLVLIDLEGNAIAFPIPEELEQYYGTARKLMEFTQEATPWAIPQIMAQGAFGFLPVDTDGFFKEDGAIDFERGWAQLGSGLLPQAVTAIYEFAAERDLFTGQDLSNYKEYNKWLNALGNVLGTGFKTVINDIGMLCGVPEKNLVGKSTANTLARDLFGVGFDNAKMEFMELIGNPYKVDPETGKETAATGLFAENEKLQKQIQGLNAQIAYSDESKKAELEEQKQTLINNFTDRVKNLTNKYMSLYTQTGGLEEWQKEKLVKILTLGESSSSAASGTYQNADSSAAYLNERALAQQRYVGAGLPGGPSLEAIGDNGSIELQAAINRFYGVNKQATQDFKNVVESSGMKNVKDEFYSVMQQIYDAADEQGKSPDYDLIERIQARYLQMMDSALIPIINQYGINVLNNNDFIDAVRRQVNGMIPSDDWRQSVRNAKKFLSTKDFPTAGVDVKKWLKKRYSSGMRDRGLASDQEVTDRLDSIRNDIDSGRYGSAKGKIEDLKTGVQKANFYISSKDLQTLNELYNMVK